MTDWSKLKVVDLKAELKNRGLPQTGLKPQLVARLATAEDEGQSESEAAIHVDASKADRSSATLPDSDAPAPQSELDSEPRGGAPTPSESTDRVVEPQNDSMDATSTKAPAELPNQSTDIPNSSKRSSQSDNHGSPPLSVDAQEAIEDRQKRKRRSLTPSLSGAEASRKRPRADESAETLADAVVTTSNDSAWVEKHNAVDQAEVNAASKEVAPAGRGVEPGPTIVDTGKEEVVVEHLAQEREEASPSRQRDSRFKGLFKAPEVEETNSRDFGHEIQDEPGHVVEPAIHPATSALYIRDFMRPLNQQQLKTHLAALATPAGRDVDHDLVANFYIDLIRTHAFVSFKSVSAAARVRSALHNSVWPDERNRKPLWVDFIPADKVDDWIDQEQTASAGGRSMAKKWEVVYHSVDEDGSIEATLEEATDQPSSRPPRQPSISGPPGALRPLSPREFDRPPVEPPFEPHAERQEAPILESRAPNSFSTLDELFKSTTAKPNLYWQPVSDSIANKRLAAISSATSKDASKRVAADINRYTFEDGEVLVDRGPEIFSGIRPPPGYRGGGRGGGGRGGFQSRGGRGGAYDSYRADGHRADGHRADGHRADGHRADGHRADGHRADNFRADGFRADGFRADNLRTDNFRSDNFRSDPYRGDGHRVDGHRSDDHRADSFRDDGFRAHGYRGDPSHRGGAPRWDRRDPRDDWHR